jgi:hypothetical protein
VAWANGGGRRPARVEFAVFFGMTTVSLLRGVAQQAATHARAEPIAGSGPHHKRQ